MVHCMDFCSARSKQAWQEPGGSCRDTKLSEAAAAAAAVWLRGAGGVHSSAARILALPSGRQDPCSSSGPHTAVQCQPVGLEGRLGSVLCWKPKCPGLESGGGEKRCTLVGGHPELGGCRGSQGLWRVSLGCSLRDMGRPGVGRGMAVAGRCVYIRVLLCSPHPSLCSMQFSMSCRCLSPCIALWDAMQLLTLCSHPLSYCDLSVGCQPFGVCTSVTPSVSVLPGNVYK